MCLSKGVFPDILKVGTVIPLFKNGSRKDICNYRPITLLSSFSKILEKLIKVRLVEYLDKIKFLDCRQYGFIKNSSTEKALLSFLSPLHNYLNENRRTASLFIDISKAFDTVNHNILLSKIAQIGIRGVALNLFKSYLSNRVQTVRINEEFSNEQLINVGVPQGSVLGPILFLIYCNSIFNLDFQGQIVAFADDIALSYSSSNVDSLKLSINQDIACLKKWFYVHNMILSSKSKVMYYSLGVSAHDSNPFIYHSLLCNKSVCDRFCVSIEVVNSFKYLGLILDSQLNFKKHVSHLKNKLCYALRSFYFLRKICSQEFLRVLYFAMIESHLQYGLSCWGGIYVSNLYSLNSIQKIVLKVMNFKPRMTPSFPLFVKCNILPLRYLYVFKVLKMFFVISGNRIINNRVIKPYLLRNSNIIKIPFPKREHFRNFFTYTAPKLFSQLPEHIIKASNIKEFSSVLKEWVMSFNDIEILFKTLI